MMPPGQVIELGMMPTHCHVLRHKVDWLRTIKVGSGHHQLRQVVRSAIDSTKISLHFPCEKSQSVSMPPSYCSKRCVHSIQSLGTAACRSRAWARAWVAMLWRWRKTAGHTVMSRRLTNGYQERRSFDEYVYDANQNKPSVMVRVCRISLFRLLPSLQMALNYRSLAYESLTWYLMRHLSLKMIKDQIILLGANVAAA